MTEPYLDEGGYRWYHCHSVSAGCSKILMKRRHGGSANLRIVTPTSVRHAPQIMKELTKKAITGLIWLQIIMAVMLFVPAWTLHFREAWAFWLLFSVLSAVVTFYFLKHDPGLVESRLKVGQTAEHEKSQKVIQTLTAILWCALVIVPGIERHFHSSRIPVGLVRQRVSRAWLLHRLSRAAGEQLGCQHYRSAAGPECHFDRTLWHRPSPNVFGRCVDDSCHAARLGLSLGLRVRGVALQRDRGAASRGGAVSLKELARLRRVLPKGSIPNHSPRLVSAVLRVFSLYCIFLCVQ